MQVGADPALAVQATLQWPPQLAVHEAWHSLVFPAEEHCALQLASQSASQDPWQSKLGALPPLHVALQLASHDPVQLTSAMTVQGILPMHVVSSWAAQEASKFRSVQSAVHPPEVSRTQLELAVASRLPQALSTAAWAGRAPKREAVAKATASVLAKTKVRPMKILPRPPLSKTRTVGTIIH
jgi:hypothetical protein